MTGYNGRRRHLDWNHFVRERADYKGDHDTLTGTTLFVKGRNIMGDHNTLTGTTLFIKGRIILEEEAKLTGAMSFV